MRYRNVRTGDEVEAEPGTELHTFCSGLPDVWEDITEPADPAEPAEPESPKQPVHAAGKREWVAYAVSRGIEQTVAARMSKTQLIATYGIPDKADG